MPPHKKRLLTNDLSLEQKNPFVWHMRFISKETNLTFETKRCIASAESRWFWNYLHGLHIFTVEWVQNRWTILTTSFIKLHLIDLSFILYVRSATFFTINTNLQKKKWIITFNQLEPLSPGIFHLNIFFLRNIWSCP